MDDIAQRIGLFAIDTLHVFLEEDRIGLGVKVVNHTLVELRLEEARQLGLGVNACFQ